MNTSLQELLFYFPLYKLAFFTTIPQEKLFYEEIHEQIPDAWLENPSLFMLHDTDQYGKLLDMDVSSRMIQDPHLVGVIICAENPVFIQEEILTLFQECGIPLLQIYDTAAYKWFQQEKVEFLPFSQLTMELNGYIEKGFSRIATEIAKALNTPILYLNDHFQIHWETGPEESLRQARRWINIHQRELGSEPSSSNPNPSTTRAEDSFKAYSLQVPGLATQWLIVSSEFTLWQKQFIDKFAGLTSIYLQSETQSQELFEKVKSHFVYDLLYHKFESQKVMIEQGKVWGWNLEKPHHLLLVDINFAEVWPGEEATINEMINEIEKGNCNKGTDTFHLISFDDQLVVLLEDERERTSADRKAYVLEFARELEAELSSKWGKDHFWLGIGNWYQDTTNLNKSYQDAKLALQFGKGWYPDQVVFHYNDLGVIRLLMHVHQGILADFSKDYLSVLMDSDRENGTEYLKTLQALIQYRWRLDEVAKILFVHPNTLRNRVKKIEEILGVDFQDSEEFSNIMIAVKIHSFFDS